MNTASTIMPAVFVGHGNPMNALQRNPYTEAWRQFGQRIAHPDTILVISAHWYTRGTAVTAMAQPPTLHDFGGFPQALFGVQYPAPGAPALAERIRDLLAPLEVRLDRNWGLDHGAWSVLVHLFPAADVPVVQLALDATQPARFHYELGQRLRPLREQGVLIIGSGNVVHNLRRAHWDDRAAPYDWAAGFNQQVRDLLLRGDHAPLVEYEQLGAAAALSVPTPEHYLPLLYVIGTQGADEHASILVDDIAMGSIGMLSVVIGSTGLATLTANH